MNPRIVRPSRDRPRGPSGLILVSAFLATAAATFLAVGQLPAGDKIRRSGFSCRLRCAIGPHCRLPKQAAFSASATARAVEKTACRSTASAGTSPDNWQSLFDGNTLGNWQSTNFGGEGEVWVEQGRIHLAMGNSLTGITYQGVVPKTNYEVQLEAMRVDGIDFFCGLTFRVGDAYCSLIVGGWAGAVVGLSSIDDRDASQNETTRYMTFENGQWYRIRVRVTAEKIEAWIDDKQVVDQNIVGRKISTRGEVDLSAPLGIATWETEAALRNLRMRQLTSE